MKPAKLGMKAVRRGIRLWTKCDAKTGYVYDTKSSPWKGRFFPRSKVRVKEWLQSCPNQSEIITMLFWYLIYFLHQRIWYSNCRFLQTALTNLPHIQYIELSAEYLIYHGYAILPWINIRVRKHFHAVKLLQYVDEHILVKGKLRRHCVLCAEKRKKTTSYAKSATCLMCMFCFTPYHT